MSGKNKEVIDVEREEVIAEEAPEIFYNNLDKDEIQDIVKTEAMKRIDSYLNLMNEAMRGESNELYTDFVVNVHTLNEITSYFYTPDEDGNYHELSGDMYYNLLEAYQAVIQSAGAVSALGGSGINEVRRNIANEITEIIRPDFAMLAALDSSKGITLPDLIFESRALTIDLGDQNLESRGGQMSSRIPIEYEAPNGEIIRGFFTKEINFDSQAEYAKIIASLKEKNPAFIDILDKIGATKPDSESLMDLFSNRDLEPYPDRKLDYIKESLLPFGIDDALTEEMLGRQGGEEFYFGLKEAFSAFALTHKCYVQDPNWIHSTEKLNIDSRNSAMSTVANLLGMPDVIAKAEPMEVIINGTGVKGTFMANANGSELYHLAPNDPMRIYGAEVYDSPQVFSQIANIQILDYICGNIDRHEGNFFLEFDTETDPEHPKLKKITGIDNDMSFMTKVPNQTDERIGNKWIKLDDMMCMSRSTFDALMHIDENILKTALKNYALSDEEITACWKRTEQIKEKVLADIEYFKANPNKKTSIGHIKVIEDNAWANYNIKELCKVPNGKFNKGGMPLNDTAMNQFRVFEDFLEYFRKNNIERELSEPLPPNPKKSGYAKGTIVLQAYEKEPESYERANQRLTVIKHGLSAQLLKAVKDASLIFRGSPEYKEMLTKLQEIDKIKFPDGVYNPQIAQDLMTKYEDLAVAAYNYISKKEKELGNGAIFGKNTEKRLAAAKRVLEAAATFNPEECHFIIQKSGELKPIENTREWEEVELRSAYNTLKAKIPGMKLDLKRTHELINQNRELINQARAIKAETEKLTHLSNGFNLGTKGARIKPYLLKGVENPEVFIKNMNATGTKGFNFRQNVGRSLLAKISEISEDSFRDCDTMEGCIRLLQEHGDAIYCIYDMNQTKEMLNQLNVPLSTADKHTLDAHYVKFQEMASAVIAKVNCLANPAFFLTDPLVMSPENIQKFKNFEPSRFRNHTVSELHNGYGSFEKYERGLNTKNKAKQLDREYLLGKTYDPSYLIKLDGSKCDAANIMTHIERGEALVCFSEQVRTGTVIKGFSEDGRLITDEGTLYDAYEATASNYNKKMQNVRAQSGRETRAFREFAEALQNLQNDFSEEMAALAVRKAQDFIHADGIIENNPKIENGIIVARKVSDTFGNPKFKEACECQFDKKKAFEKGRERANKFLGQIKDEDTFAQKKIAANREIAKFEDTVSSLPEGEIKTLGKMAVKAKQMLADITTSIKFGDQLKASVKGCFAVILAFEDSMKRGPLAMSKEQFLEVPGMDELVNSMDRNKLKDFVIENKEKLIVKGLGPNAPEKLIKAENNPNINVEPVAHH